MIWCGMHRFPDFVIRAPTISVLALFVALLCPRQVFAACLLGDYSVTPEYGRSEAVIVGRVLSSRSLPDPDDPQVLTGTVYSVKIVEALRGSPGKVVDVYSENSGGSFPLKAGEKYLLCLYRQEGQLSADYCGHSGLVTQRARELVGVRLLTNSVVGVVQYSRQSLLREQQRITIDGHSKT